MTPVIGIVMCGIENNRQFVSCPYINAIQKSGGLPVVIPCSVPDPDYLSLCDGFLFCGGGDVTPLLFGEEPLTDKGSTDLKTDMFHLEFMKLVLKSQKPVLGICRGMQIMNLALGGSIYQDLSLLEHSHICHMQLSQERSDPSHKITISESSALHSICGTSASVNSFHHQCVKTLGAGLQISAISSDRVIEAIELPNHPFALGVQWHPECMYDTMKEIFLKFVEKGTG